MPASEATISVKNFERFQHYKDRTPPWIKLYNDLLDDYDFARLQDASKLHLVLIWLLASRYDNRIPADPEWIARRINATDPVLLEPLLSAGFITMSQTASGTLAIVGQDASPEVEVEREVEKQENLTDTNATHSADAEVEPNEARARLAPLIRKHLWLGGKPPAFMVAKHPDWDMGRELNCAAAVVKKAGSNVDEMCGVIELARTVLGENEATPLSVATFNVNDRLDRFNVCLGVWRKRQERNTDGPQLIPFRAAS